jgi:hypothetical protein
MILNAVNRIQNGTGGLEARMTQKELKQKMLKDYLEGNMSMLDDNIKKGIKESIFVFRLISSLQHGQGGIVGKKP